MTIDLEDEILQDFLVEAGEILDSLNEQLIELEKSPTDSDLLNAIFRGFHTIKGGGGFLSLDNLVDVCHKSEDVFNLLRSHKISLTPDMMDAFLRVLDEVNRMFAELKSGEQPSAAEAALIKQLINMQTDSGTPLPEPTPALKEGRKVESKKGPSSKVQQVEGSDQYKTPTEGFVSGTDEITDQEFEALLDTLHGKGGKPRIVPEVETTAPVSAESQQPKVEPVKSDNDIISDDEFENLLDEIHGKGKGPTSLPVKETTGKGKSGIYNPIVNTQRNDYRAIKEDTTVRVDTSRLDDIMNLVGELVLTRNRLITLRETSDDENLHQAISDFEVVTADLQTAVVKTRMQPIKKVFGRFPRVVRDLARSMQKEISLELEGEETDLDKNLVEALADPLVHLVRNAVDHGIEAPDEREKAGKPRQGIVELSAQQEGDHILLSIKDDGAGMDPEKLREKAVAKGLIDEKTASMLDNRGCYDLIFMPGLTTMEKTSNVSGRGVGMDVVKTKISQLNGTIDIDSERGKGTEIHIKVPLTLAIMPTLMVKLGKRKFAVPLSVVNEIFNFSSKSFSVVDGQEVVLNRDKAPPVFHLRKWLLNGHDAESESEGDPHIIMVQAGKDTVGFVVDQVIGQEEVVIKPLDKLLRGLPGMAGSTITGDGNIAIILDVPGLLKFYA